MSDIIEFPKWLYHKTEEAVIVQDAEGQKSLGKDWKEVPFEGSAKPVEQGLQQDFEVLAQEDEAKDLEEVPKKKKGSK